MEGQAHRLTFLKRSLRDFKFHRALLVSAVSTELLGLNNHPSKAQFYVDRIFQTKHSNTSFNNGRGHFTSGLPDATCNSQLL